MSFAKEIIKWYQLNKRDLPWRKTKDPYIIWLSEIIMQQTRVEQGMPYFERFAEKYPGVADFASADEGEILKDWQGLGYYSRGRNMHITARVVMEEFQGYFPSSYKQLIKLKGIGEYTAAAISSFSANEPKAVVDGNVFRLLARYYGIGTPINSSAGKKVFTNLANEIIDISQPGTFNQAIMEFGSMQCRPKNPLCTSCPLQLECVAYNTGKINELPVKIRLKPSRIRYFNFLLIFREGKILMNQRGPGDIWENLYEMPLYESRVDLQPDELLQTPGFIDQFGNGLQVSKIFPQVKHLLSHQTLYARFLGVENFSEQIASDNGWIYVGVEDLERLAQPKLIFEFFNKNLKFN